ncbi:MAG: hypothetical protein Q9172_004193 [Xanthocarpia lactea]
MNNENTPLLSQSRLTSPAKAKGKGEENITLSPRGPDQNVNEDIQLSPQKAHSAEQASAIRPQTSQTQPLQYQTSPHQSTRIRRKGSLIMQRAFAAALEHPESVVPDTRPRPTESDRIYFFYGNLMDANKLASVLGLIEEPKLRVTRVEGFRTDFWGQHPAMLLSDDGIVQGMTYRIGNVDEIEDQVAKLKRYQGDKYRRRMVDIEFEDGSSLYGYTFVWAGNVEELRQGILNIKA